ncbi:MAG: hypothetical protein ACD_85C00001G0015 [uncultured bacterium]|nr:MAG: hypothetical protein ACD_85C00001G0015 [uncultured bacterium]
MFIDIKGFEGLYSISPCGEIRSIYRKTHLKGWTEKVGYRAVSLWKDGQQHRRTVHSLLAEAFIPNPLNLPEVNHKDGVKLNNSLGNLEWVSGSGNIRHAFSSGLAKYSPIIDYEKVPDILQEVLAGIPLRDIASRENLSETSTLRKLLKREAIRTGQLEAFQKGAKAANRNLVQERSQPIVQKTLTGSTVQNHVSINEAARTIDCNPAAIFKALKYARPYRGYTWERQHA